VYGVLPFSIAFLAAFNVLTASVSRKRLFNTIIYGFMAYIGIFAFLMLPNTASLHPHTMAEKWLQVLPSGLAGGVAVVRNWSFSLFYCASEMWGDICLSLLFWSLANETTSMTDAAILYPLFGIGANVAQVLAGQFLKNVGGAAGSFTSQFQALSAVLLVFGAAIVLLHEHVSRTATFRTDSLDVSKGSHTENSAHSSDLERPKEGGSAGEVITCKDRGGDINTSTKASHTAVRVPENGAAIELQGALNFAKSGSRGWDPSAGCSGGQFVSCASRGGGVVMQVAGNRCVCVRMAHDQPQGILAVHGRTDAPGIGQVRPQALPVATSAEVVGPSGNNTGELGRQHQERIAREASASIGKDEKEARFTRKPAPSFFDAMR
jgi:hypothetical protein